MTNLPGAGAVSIDTCYLYTIGVARHHQMTATQDGREGTEVSASNTH